MNVNPARLSATLTLMALEALSICVFVVDQTTCEVRMMNPLAVKLAASNAPIRVRNGRLSLHDARLDDELRETVRKAAPERGLSAGGAMVIPAGQGEPLLLMVMALSPDIGISSFSEPLAVVLVGDPSHRPEPDAELIKALYGLTSAETRVLLAIVQGQSLADYARMAKVSGNTARSQAKSVFAKTGCRRQADLVAKVLNRPILRIAGTRK